MDNFNSGKFFGKRLSAAFPPIVGRDMNLFFCFIFFSRLGHVEQRECLRAALDFFSFSAKQLSTEVADLLQQDVGFLFMDFPQTRHLAM